MVALTAPTPSMAIALQTPSRAPAMSSNSALNAGRRKFEEYKKKQRKASTTTTKKTIEKPADPRELGSTPDWNGVLEDGTLQKSDSSLKTVSEPSTAPSYQKIESAAVEQHVEEAPERQDATLRTSTFLPVPAKQSVEEPLPRAPLQTNLLNRLPKEQSFSTWNSSIAVPAQQHVLDNEDTLKEIKMRKDEDKLSTLAFSSKRSEETFPFHRRTIGTSFEPALNLKNDSATVERKDLLLERKANDASSLGLSKDDSIKPSNGGSLAVAPPSYSTSLEQMFRFHPRPGLNSNNDFATIKRVEDLSQENNKPNDVSLGSKKDDSVQPEQHIEDLSDGKPTLQPILPTLDQHNEKLLHPLNRKASDPYLSSRKDDFAALEQHIEDLTQEKFSLQRGLDKARALVESLSQANSALTEDYNQQGAKVNELKDEISRYQEQLRAQEIAVKTLRAERDKARQESNAAKERSQALAAEAIALEDKVLKTRSREIKLQKELEALQGEIESCRKQISSIEKDRLNAISMNEALQEEKKVLLLRVREAAEKVSPVKEDASTSTEDLVTEHESTSTLQSEQETSSPFDSVLYPTSIPAEQLGIIESINTLVSELGEEKEAILRALRNESNMVAQLKAENAELSRKLERQTQQLELAVSQNMSRIGTSMSPTVSQTTEEMEYVDEGDEVVDRVLGWIMRLFPGGGSSRRGGSKQL